MGSPNWFVVTNNDIIQNDKLLHSGSLLTNMGVEAAQGGCEKVYWNGAVQHHMFRGWKRITA